MLDHFTDCSVHFSYHYQSRICFHDKLLVYSADQRKPTERCLNSCYLRGIVLTSPSISRYVGGLDLNQTKIHILRPCYWNRHQTQSQQYIFFKSITSFINPSFCHNSLSHFYLFFTCFLCNHLTTLSVTSLIVLSDKSLITLYYFILATRPGFARVINILQVLTCFVCCRIPST